MSHFGLPLKAALKIFLYSRDWVLEGKIILFLLASFLYKPANRKISWSSLGAGGSKDSQESTILLAVASTISKATQGLGGRGGRFLFRRGTKMGEEMMWEGRRFGEGE